MARRIHPENSVANNTIQKATQASTGIRPKYRKLQYDAFVYSVSFSPDGLTIVSGSDDNTVRIWDVASGTEIKQLTGHTSFVTSVSFSPDGSTIASGSWDNTVRIWDVAS